MRAKSRQRKRHRLNVVLIKNDSLSKIFLVRIFQPVFLPGGATGDRGSFYGREYYQDRYCSAC